MGALAEIGLHGCAPAPAAAWCHALGVMGVSSVLAKELFEMLDLDRTGSVSPSALCDADLAQEALAGSLRTSLDVIYIVQLRYRLLLRGCHAAFGLVASSTFGPARLAALCQERLGLTDVDQADAEALIRDMRLRAGGGVDAISYDFGFVNDAIGGVAPPREFEFAVGAMCHQFASWTTTAPKLANWTLMPERPGSCRDSGAAASSPSDAHLARAVCTDLGGPPWLPVPLSSPPAVFVGKTPVEIIVRYKDPATFPWHRLPESASGRRFEELWRLASGPPPRHRAAEDAVRLLVDPALDRVRKSN